MKIAYIDLNYADHYESYSIRPKKYGGGRIFASWAKELISNFHIFSSKNSFIDLQDNENKNACHIISNEQQQKLREGNKIEDICPDLNNFDIIVHHFSNIHLNTNKPQIVWSIGYGEHIHQELKHLMLYSRNRQNPIYLGNKPNIYDIKIGVDVPKNFKENIKQDYIFQCTRHVQEFGSIQVAELCLKHKIKCIFAGPINDNYPLMNYIDNNYTNYIGIITEEEKINYTKQARACTFIHSWPTPFNLSAIDSLAHGTPLITTSIGFWPDLIEENNNGFIVNNEETFIEAWKKSLHINQKNCFNTAQHYNIETMIKSFYESIQKCYESF